MAIKGSIKGDLPDTLVFDAGVALDDQGRRVTAGGRVIGVVGRARSINLARIRANDRAKRIRYHNKSGRTDIATNL